MKVIKSDLGYFIILGLMFMFIGVYVVKVYVDLCCEVVLEVLVFCDVFGILEEVFSVLIVRDWIKYNLIDNKGEVSGVEF